MEFSVLDSIEPVAVEWDDLATRAGASPFLRPGWFQCWWDAFAKGRLEIVTMRRDGRLAGVAALFRHRGSLLATANVHSPEFALLGENAEATRELTEHLYGGNPLHVALCYLHGDTPATFEVYRALRQNARR